MGRRGDFFLRRRWNKEDRKTQKKKNRNFNLKLKF